MRRYSLSLVILLLSLGHLSAQSPKREFRAAWIATVSNIDWPSKQGLPAQQQQQEFIYRLDQLKSIGCNAVIVQIRPAADAFYQSAIEPWSHYLTGRQGIAPFPYYDPLVFMIEEAHKRNMEFHAWFNPFRALTESNKNPNPANHVTKQHPDWIISYGGKSYINPGIPAARDYVVDVIMDVVKRYDIDAVHLDDYFYPYRIAGQEFGDNRSFSQYNIGGFTDKGDWRRDNVNRFVLQLNSTIKRVKPTLKFGISPFGVWRNSSKDPEGSPTRGGQTCYDDLYSDVVLWMQKGWIDYLMPQLYWERYHRLVGFEVLLPWWDAHKYNRHMYYGLGLYRMLNAPRGVWADTYELTSQMRDIRRIGNSGFSFYSSSNFDKIYTPIKDSIAATNRHFAMPPVMKWLDSIAPSPPVLKAIPSYQGTLLQWQGNNPTKEKLRFVVYRFINDEPVDLERADRIINILSGYEFMDVNANKYKQCKYVVTAVDRLWNESKAGNVAVTGTDK